MGEEPKGVMSEEGRFRLSNDALAVPKRDNPRTLSGRESLGKHVTFDETVRNYPVAFFSLFGSL
jgi:hypothetical protein